MATIKQRKTKYSVIYWYLNGAGERKQKWDTLETKKDAKARKAYIEFYQQKNGFVLVPPERLQAKPEPVSEVPRVKGKSTGRCVQPAKIKKIHDNIRCALNQAIRWKYLDTRMRNPASLATLPKMTKV